MISKNSFWASLRENNKRRIWLWVVSWLIWFFSYPVGMALICSRVRNSFSYNGRMVAGSAAATKEMAEAVSDWLRISSGFYVLVIGFAVICAIQGFSYLYSKKKMDFYGSMPVPAGRRFAVIVANSVLIFLIPYSVCLLLSYGVAALNGVPGNPLWEFLGNVALHLLLYLGIYGITAIAVMLTGNIVITFLATAIFLGYEYFIGDMFSAYQSEYFEYYSYWGVKTTLYLQPTEPFMQLVEKMTFAPVLWLVLQIVVFLLIAYICYRKRPAEAAGKSMAFSVTKPVVKFLLTVPATLAAGMIVSNELGGQMESDGALLQIFIMVVALVLSNCVIEVIYELDMRAALHKKRQILASGICVAAIFCAFRFDVFGYDAWIPEKEELEEAVVVVSQMEDLSGEPWSKDALGSIEDSIFNREEYYETVSGVRDVEAVIDLSKARNSYNDDYRADCTVGYRLKNGKTIWRNFYVNTDGEDALNRIMQNQNFKEAAFQIYDKTLYNSIKENLKISLDRGISVENLPQEEADRIRELFIEDMKNFDYYLARDEYPVGQLRFTQNIVESGYREQTDIFLYPVYPSFKNLLSYLEEKGIYLDNYVNPEDVESIAITNRNKDLEEAYYAENVEQKDFLVSTTYKDPEQIKEIVKALYPSDLPRVWKDSQIIYNDLVVSVRLKTAAGNSSYYRGNDDFYLIQNKLPSYVLTDTAYK